MVEDSRDKKKAIFESTLELVRERGFHGTPMSLVAKQADVAAGTIYHYFESKDHLICELYEYCREKVTAVIEASLKEEDSYQANFLRIWHGLYDFYVREPNILIFFEQYINSPFNHNKSANYSRSALFTFFSEGIGKKTLKAAKPEILLLLVMSSISSTAKLHVFGRVPLGKADLNRIAEIMWDGIASEEGRSDGKNKSKTQTSTNK